MEPLGPLGDDNLDKIGPHENGVPPYVIPGSLWEEQWKEDNVDGWDQVSPNNFFLSTQWLAFYSFALPNSVWLLQLKFPWKAVSEGDMRVLEMLAKVKPEALVEKDANGWAPIHIAVQHGRLDVIKFLLEHGASTKDTTGPPGGIKTLERIPLEISVQLWGYEHEVTKYLWDNTKF